MTKAPRGQLKKAELLVAPVACRVCGLRWRRRRGERESPRVAEVDVLHKRCFHEAVATGPVSLPVSGFLQSTEHRDLSSKQFSFFAQQLFRESAISSLRRESFRGFPSFPSQCFFSPCWIGFRRCSSFFLLLFLLILWFFLLEGRGGFRRWCERLCSFGLRGVRVSVLLGVLPCIYCMALSISPVSFIFWTALCVGSIGGCR